ncbi:MAG: SBBP repeat-containing protein, partial [Methylococcales bacterium]|nr:SBBP repeat-containing protein [Methylococcales bacterium]
MLNNYRTNRFFFLAILLILTFATVTLTLQAGGSQDTATVIYSTYIGGGISEDGVSIVVDNAGNSYLTGNTTSTNFPTQTLQTSHGIDVIAIKLSPTGGAEYLKWVNAATLSAPDYGFGAAIDGDGNMYVVGDTASSDFCLYFGAGIPGYDTTYNGNADAFVLKLDSDGQVVYCTFLGGPTDSEVARAVAVDDAGNAYITGGTWSTDFPGTTPGDHHGAR